LVGETLNLGMGREVKINEVARMVIDVVGSDAAIVHDAARPGDVRRLCADTRRAQELLGFVPAVSLAEGLARTVEWYRRLGVPAAQLVAEQPLRNWV
jgi:nucleoside-diphosphate-sugar epimerase